VPRQENFFRPGQALCGEHQARALVGPAQSVRRDRISVARRGHVTAQIDRAGIPRTCVTSDDALAWDLIGKLAHNVSAMLNREGRQMHMKNEA